LEIITNVLKCGLKVFPNLSKPPLVFPKRMLQEKEEAISEKKGEKKKEALSNPLAHFLFPLNQPTPSPAHLPLFWSSSSAVRQRS
jgi:hypothetical protein